MENQTHEKIYSILLDMREKQGSVDEKLENLTKTIGEIKEQTTKTNGRVSLLEAFNLKLKTKVGVFASIFGLVGGVAMALLKDKISQLFS